MLAGSRRPDSYQGPGRPVNVDLESRRSILAALGGCGAVYYLVHSLNTPDFERRDRQLAETFADAAEERVDQVVYLGGTARATSYCVNWSLGSRSDRARGSCWHRVRCRP